MGITKINSSENLCEGVCAYRGRLTGSLIISYMLFYGEERLKNFTFSFLQHKRVRKKTMSKNSSFFVKSSLGAEDGNFCMIPGIINLGCGEK